MKIALVAPNSRHHTLIPPLGLGYLAASVRPKGHEVVIVDMAKEGWNAAQGVEAVTRINPDLVGISVLSTSYLPSREFVKALQQKAPSLPVIAGGPHVTALPRQTLDDFGIDMGMIGEGEHAFPALIEKLDSGASLEQVPSLCYRDNGGFRLTERAPFFQEIDKLPFPAWDVMDPRTYPDMPHQLLHKRFPVAPILTTRGCPHDCSFCASTKLWGKRLRTRTPENVVDEIELLVNEYGVREIHFEDDNFTQNRRHVTQVCEEILRRGLKFLWACPNGVRVDSLDDDILALMRRAGCYSVGLGIESGSQEVLDRNHKRLKLEKVPEQVKMIKSHGIATHGFFIIGLPGETDKTVRETLKFSRKVRFDRANFSLLAPLPGSDIFEQYARGPEGSASFDFKTLNYFTPFPIGGLEADELKSWQRRAVLGFYLRPRQVIHLLTRFRLSQTLKIARALLDYT